jgi:hypothetical protein
VASVQAAPIIVQLVAVELGRTVDRSVCKGRGWGWRRSPAIDDIGVAWIEQPIVYDNLEGYARLTADLKTPDEKPTKSIATAIFASNVSTAAPRSVLGTVRRG